MEAGCEIFLRRTAACGVTCIQMVTGGGTPIGSGGLVGEGGRHDRISRTETVLPPASDSLTPPAGER